MILLDWNSKIDEWSQNLFKLTSSKAVGILKKNSSTNISVKTNTSSIKPNIVEAALDGDLNVEQEEKRVQDKVSLYWKATQEKEFKYGMM